MGEWVNGRTTVSLTSPFLIGFLEILQERIIRRGAGEIIRERRVSKGKEVIGSKRARPCSFSKEYKEVLLDCASGGWSVSWSCSLLLQESLCPSSLLSPF